MVSREVWGLRDGTPTNKGNTFRARETPTNKKKHQQTRKNKKKTPTNKKKQEKKHQQTRETPFKQEKYISGKETPFKQGVSSDQM